MINKIFLSKKTIYIITAIASILLTIIVLARKQPFNVDGIMYLDAAHKFMNSGFNVSFMGYKWPFYSILISLIAEFSGLSILNAAYLLDAVLYVAIALFFVMLIKEFGGSGKTQWIGSLLIVFFPHLVKFCSDIMRDHGYIAFSLLALVGLIKYFRTKQWRFAILWGTAMMIATLFRIEGAIFLCFLPLGLLFTPDMNFWRKLGYLIRGQIVLIISFILAIGFWLVFGHSRAMDINTGRLPELMFQLQHGIQTIHSMLANRISIVKAQIFTIAPSYRGGEAVFLFGGLLAFYLGCVISVLGVLYSGVFLYTVRKQIFQIDWAAKAVWIGAIILNILITLLFLAQQLFLVDRYVAMLSILLLVAVSFGIEWIYRNNKKLFFIVAIWFLAIMFSDIIHIGPSKTYIIESGQWVVRNIPLESKIYCNDLQLYYYTDNHSGLLDQDLIHFNAKQLRHFDYAVIKIKKDCSPNDCLLELYFKTAPIKEFHSNRGDRVLIYKL